MNFISIAREVTMNPDNVNAEALRPLRELHTKQVLQREKRLLDLMVYMEYAVKYTEFLNYTGSVISINIFSIFKLPSSIFTQHSKKLPSICSSANNLPCFSVAMVTQAQRHVVM